MQHTIPVQCSPALALELRSNTSTFQLVPPIQTTRIIGNSRRITKLMNKKNGRLHLVWGFLYSILPELICSLFICLFFHVEFFSVVFQFFFSFSLFEFVMTKPTSAYVSTQQECKQLKSCNVQLSKSGNVTNLFLCSEQQVQQCLLLRGEKIGKFEN